MFRFLRSLARIEQRSASDSPRTPAGLSSILRRRPRAARRRGVRRLFVAAAEILEERALLAASVLAASHAHHRDRDSQREAARGDAADESLPNETALQRPAVQSPQSAASPIAQSQGIWISKDELMRLPTSGKAWETLVRSASKDASRPNISDQNDGTDAIALAKALVGVRTNDQRLINEARGSIMAAIGTEAGGRTLALGRNLTSYVIAADLVGLAPDQEARFRGWLRTTLTENLDGKTLRSTHELRPNNWGTMAGASRAAVAVYLGDQAELARVAQVFKGWLGDRSSYAGFKFGGDLSWQADPKHPVAINPAGAVKGGHSIDGALPEEMRRGGSFRWPPAPTGYAWEALQGAFVQAEILHRAGYAAYDWQNRALLRSVKFVESLGWHAAGDDRWLPWLIDARYGTHYATDATASPGKLMGWTAWTHQSVA